MGELSFLVVGLGSIGQRHLRNLQQLGYRKLIGLSTSFPETGNSDFPGIKIVRELNQGLALKPDAVLVCNPTALHLEIAMKAALAGCHLFIEKPLSHTLEGMEELKLLAESRKLIVQTGFQFRFHPLLIKVREIINKGTIGKPLSVQLSWGEFLPSWHPWEDYRKGYSARKDLGGGVILTLCHPLDYLRWIFGEVTEVMAMSAGSTHLETDVEDIALAGLRFKSGMIASVYLDYVRKPSAHQMTIIGEEGVISWDNNKGITEIYGESKEMMKTFKTAESFERNQLFKDELKSFIECIKKDEQPVCNLADGIASLELTLAVKDSAEKQERIYLSLRNFD